MNLKTLIRDVPDFPKPGIVFKDITPLLLHPEALSSACDQIARHFRRKLVEKVLAVEARGFIFAALVAERLRAGLIPVRKPGKLPHETVSVSYSLEYGTDTLEMHRDAIAPRDRVLVVDDVLATGGTVQACCDLIEKMKGQVVGCAFVIELSFLKGREKLKGREVLSLIQYEKD